MQEIIVGIVEIFFELLVVLFFGIIFLGMPYFFYYRIKNKVKKENMSKIDFSKEKDYFRDILKGYSPAELSYIDDYEIQIPREIVATLLSLKLKQKIEITKEKVIIINSDITGLKSTEKFILKNIKDGKVKIRHFTNLEWQVQNEAIEDDLIEKNTFEKKKKRIMKRALRVGLELMLLVVSFNFFINNIEEFNRYSAFIQLIIVVGECILFLYLGSSLLRFIFYLGEQSKSYSRTKKGEELNKKIEGLKKYIKEYSLLDEKKREDLELWEEYLIYSVIFDNNSNTIVEEILELIEI